jgi:hypothetical protein
MASLLLVFEARSQQTEPARPSLPCFVHQVKTIMIAAQIPTTPTMLVMGWKTIYFGFEWLVVPFVFVYDLGALAV